MYIRVCDWCRFSREGIHNDERLTRAFDSALFHMQKSSFENWAAFVSFMILVETT